MKSSAHVLAVRRDQLMYLPLSIVIQLRLYNETERVKDRAHELKEDRGGEPKSIALQHYLLGYFAVLASARPGSCDRSSASSSISPPGETGMSAGFVYLYPLSSETGSAP